MTYKEIIIEALDNEEMLNSWEWDFILSVADKPNGWTPTQKQADVLDQVECRLLG